MPTVIEVERIGKQYRVPPRVQRDTAAGRSNWFGRGIRRWSTPCGSTPDETAFQALSDVSFDVRRGEVMGIIGRNGAGKSTLLKILSRITPPSSGRVRMRGRVASLLEVGTGFHRELTGRENIQLSGALLGMSRAEIASRFDEIVAFAEVDRFVDTPVKHYSSGMYVRLAFAVAAHLQPEILLVDEVLSVGDAGFQKKCLGKMEDVSRQGRTILFVSHNMAAVQGLCTRGCFLESGRVACLGAVEDAVGAYLRHWSSLSAVPLAERSDRSGSGEVRITALSVESAAGAGLVRSGDPLRVTITYESPRAALSPRFVVGIFDAMNVPMFRLDSEAAGQLPDRLRARGTVTCETGPLQATPGACFVNVAAFVGGQVADFVTQAAELAVEPTDFFGTGRMFDRRDALFLLEQRWSVV